MALGRDFWQRVLPKRVQDAVRRARHKLPRRNPVGGIDFGGLRRVEPISRGWGYRRGKPVGRHYIEKFLDAHRSDIRGHALEIADDLYSSRFGSGRVTKVDVLHVVPGNPKATIVADLTRADHLPGEQFDVIVLTQTLPVIYDLRAAIGSVHRLLKPSGTVLATVPGLSPISSYDMDRWGDYWRFTPLSARRSFEESFGAGNVDVVSYGNVLAAVANLHGLAVEDVSPEELEPTDPDFPVTIAVRAVKRPRG